MKNNATRTIRSEEITTGVRTVSVVHLAPVLRLLASIATVLSPSSPFGIRM